MNNAASESQTVSNGLNKKTARRLPDKIFEERKSLLTELLELKHFRTIKHIFYAVLFGFVCNDVYHGFFLDKEVYFGLRLIKVGFARFYLLVFSWCLLFCDHLFTFVGFKVWTTGRVKINPKSDLLKWWDRGFLWIFIGYIIYSLYFIPVLAIRILDMPVLSTGVLIIELMRLTMKSYAFVRSNAPNVLKHKVHSDEVLQTPTISQFLYYSFAPTLIYRNEYPRTKSTNKTHAIMCFVEVALLIWLQSFIHETFFVSKYKFTGKIELNWKYVFAMMLENIIPGMLIMLLNFYLILHVWMNGFAEIMQFADRKFYEDWWSSTNYSIYFRTWNVLVQDWLYAYIYKDFYEIITPNNKHIPRVMVLFVSAVFHEYLLSLMLRQFFPILFIFFFVVGSLLLLIDTRHQVYNIFFWYGLALGNSIVISLYTMEFYARGNCAIKDINSIYPVMLSPDCPSSR